MLEYIHSLYACIRVSHSFSLIIPDFATNTLKSPHRSYFLVEFQLFPHEIPDFFWAVQISGDPIILYSVESFGSKHAQAFELYMIFRLDLLNGSCINFLPNCSNIWDEGDKYFFFTAKSMKTSFCWWYVPFELIFVCRWGPNFSLHDLSIPLTWENQMCPWP